MIDLSVDIAGMKLAKPIMTASGTAGYADELADFVDLKQIGAFVTKTITLEPRAGNAYPRVIETASGLVNAIGLANIGLDAFLAEKIPILSEYGLPIIVSVAGKTVEEYRSITERLDSVDAISAVELNISCPNVSEGGIQFGTDARQVAKVTAAARRACNRKVLIVKLSPNVTDITTPARAAIEAGADAISLINTLNAMVIDIEQRKPFLANRTGGLSGPAIHPVALYMVYQVCSSVAGPAGVPVIAMGGVRTARDAIEFLLAGATAVAIGTAAMINPTCLIEVCDGIRDYLLEHNHKSVKEIIGTLQDD